MSLRGNLARVLVIATVAIAVTIGFWLDVPLGYGWAGILVTVLVGLFLVRDERFWIGLTILLIIFTGIGAVLLGLLAHNFEEPQRGALWYGGRELVFWGGLHANPSYPQWGWTVVALAVTRFGLPLALVLTLSWLVSTRHDLTRGERLALVLASNTLLTAVLLGATAWVVVVGVGALQGLPLGLAAIGAAGALFTLLTVGPGAVAGVLVGGRTLASYVPGASQSTWSIARSAEEIHRSGSGVATEETEPIVHSLVRFSTNNVGWLQRLNLRFLKWFGVLVTLGLLGVGCLPRIDSSRVHFEYVSKQVGVGFRVRSAFHPSSGGIWLVGETQIARFDGGKRMVNVDVQRVVAAASSGSQLFILTKSRPSRILRIGAEGSSRAFELGNETKGSGIAVTTDSIYISSTDGKVSRYHRTRGQLLSSVSTSPAIGMYIESGELVTEHDHAVQTPSGMSYVVRRDPESLAAIGPASETTYIDETCPAAQALAESELQKFLSRLAAARHVIEARHRCELWMSRGIGRLDHFGADGKFTRFDFHYDSILDVLEAPEGIWLLADNDQGIVTDEDNVSESHLVLWKPVQ